MIITGFQLRAAKISLKLDYNTIHKDTEVSKVTLGRLIKTTQNHENISCSAKDAYTLYTYFCNKGLDFPDNHSIYMDYIIEPKTTDNNLTRFQFIVARTALHLSQRDLVKYIDNITRGSFQKFEKKENNAYLASRKIPTRNVISFFNTQGVCFPNNKSVAIDIKK